MHSSLRNAIKLVTPPIIPALVRRVQALPTRGRLFDGHDDIFLEQVSKATSYGEYGCGASTIWTANNTSLDIVSVDTSKVWLDHVKATIDRTDGVHSVFVDLGPLGDWGRPKNYAARTKFVDYVDAPWAEGRAPDLVLVDGRFRMACFLTSLMRAKPGTVIIFDDYAGRAHFEMAEDFVEPFQRNARQAAFLVPQQIDFANIAAERDRFLYVME